MSLPFRKPRASSARTVPTIGQPRSAPPTLDAHLLDYLRVLIKRRWTAVIGLALALAIAGAHAYTATSLYEATAQILIEHENQNEFSLRDSVAQDRETTDYYHTQYTILESRTLARRAIEAIGGWNHAELTGRFGPIAAQPTGVFAGALGALSSTFARLRGQRPAQAETTGGARRSDGGSPPSGPTGESPAQASVIDAFLARLTVAPVKNSRLVDLKFIAADPKLSAEAANALARAYIDQNLETRVTASKETSDWLAQQLTDQRRRIEASERALQQYREKQDAGSLGDRQSMVAQKLTDLNAMVTRAKADRIQREALYNQVKQLQGSATRLDTLPAMLVNTTLQQLRAEASRLHAQHNQLAQQLGDRHPEMIKLKASIEDTESRVKQELTNQVDVIKNEFEAAVNLEANLTGALDAQKQEAIALNRKGIDYGALEREATTNRQIFESLLERTREKGIAGELKASDVRVIDAAQVPRGPFWPNRQQIMLYAVFFGSLFGIALAFFRDYLDDRIKTPDEIKTYLGLPVLGLIPLVDRKPQKPQTPLLTRGASPLFAEACRSVRTNVIFSAEQERHCLVVTSTGPGEGKTVVSVNLAVGLALTGQRVMLLDVDMRRPRVHEAFGIAQEPGLSDILRKAGDSRSHQVSVPGLSVLPSGRTPDNPTELLSSPQFARLLESLTKRFDWVIIDSPPVAAVTDASIVSNLASAVLFVVGSEQTSRSSAVNAVDQLSAANATFIGAVLNRVKLKRDAFYYSAYYRSDYEHYQKSASR